MQLNIRFTSQKFMRSEFGLLFTLIGINILIGYLIVTDYGMSVDEPGDISYGNTALRAYAGSEDFLWEGHDRKYYGPFYWMVASQSSKLLNAIQPGWKDVDTWHFISFLSFQLAIISFYFLCKRFVNKRAAFLTSLLYATQPLLFGHAFINQKDIPFMAFFLLSVVMGLANFDRLLDSEGTGKGRSKRRANRAIFE